MDRASSILMVAAEYAPLAKTGGLGDITRTVADAMRRRGRHVRVVIPGYRSVLACFDTKTDHRLTLRILGRDVQVLCRNLDGIEIVALRCDALFDRNGGPYLDENRKAWPDNALRFGVLCRAAAEIANGRTELARPDVLNLYDWHAALVPAYLDAGAAVPTALVVQNFMFQGRFPLDVLPQLQIERSSDIVRAGMLFGGFGFLRVGLALADRILTASPGYAREMATPDRFNWYYLSETDRARLSSITNWAGTEGWQPATDEFISVRYDAKTLHLRRRNRTALQRELGWAQDDRPILCTMSRITRAKGFGFLLRQAANLIGKGCRIVVVGDGDRRLINALQGLSGANPADVALLTPYTEAAAHRVLAGSDMLLMPSLTEPCGLSQQHAQAYGCIPVVSRVGGLTDTVLDGETGFLFEPSSAASFAHAIDRALGLYGTTEWPELQARCMRYQAGFDNGDRYAELFDDMIAEARSSLPRATPA